MENISWRCLNAWIRCFDAHIRATRVGPAARPEARGGELGGPANIRGEPLRALHLAAVLQLLLPIAEGEILLRARRVHELHLRIAQVPGRAVGRDIGKRRAPACNCRPSATTDLLLAPGEPASDAIWTTALTRP